MPPHFIGDFGREPSPRIEHGQHNPQYLQARVQHLRHQAQCLAKLAQPLERVVLALDGDDHRLRGGETVHREQAQRGWAVQQHVVVRRNHRAQAHSQSGLPGQLSDQLHLGSGEIHSCRR